MGRSLRKNEGARKDVLEKARERNVIATKLGKRGGARDTIRKAGTGTSSRWSLGQSLRRGGQERLWSALGLTKMGDGLLSGDICPPGGAPGTQPLSRPLSAGQFSFLNLAPSAKAGRARIRGWECRIEKWSTGSCFGRCLLSLLCAWPERSASLQRFPGLYQVHTIKRPIFGWQLQFKIGCYSAQQFHFWEFVLKKSLSVKRLVQRCSLEHYL